MKNVKLGFIILLFLSQRNSALAQDGSLDLIKSQTHEKVRFMELDTAGICFYHQIQSQDTSNLSGEINQFNNQIIRCNYGDSLELLIIYVEEPNWEYSSIKIFIRDGNVFYFEVTGASGDMVYRSQYYCTNSSQCFLHIYHHNYPFNDVEPPVDSEVVLNPPKSAWDLIEIPSYLVPYVHVQSK